MKYFFGWLLAFGISMNAFPQNLASKFFPAFAAYEREVQHFENGKSKLTLEQLYKKGNALEQLWAKDLANVYQNNVSKSGLFNEDQYDRQIKPYHDLAKKRSNRFVLAHEETVIARPTLSFYGQLAEKHGSQADLAFFKLMLGLYEDVKLWPSYMMQMTDYSGCINFGNGELSKQYGAWTRYAAQYPNAYKNEAAKTIADIASELVQGTCACGGVQNFQSELNLFIKTHPQSKLTPLLAQRLASPQHAPPKGLALAMRFNCSPG